MAIKDYNGNTPSTSANATTTEPGLMSPEDKTKLDSLEIIDTLPIGSEVLIDSNIDIPDGWEENGNVVGSNPNILINGDFQIRTIKNLSSSGTVSTTSGDNKFFSNRWKIYTVESSKSVEYTYNEDGSVTLSSDYSFGIQQLIEKNISIMDSCTLSFKLGDSIYTYTMTNTKTTYYSDDNYVIIRNGSVSDVEISSRLINNKPLYWVKLEEGTVATPLIIDPILELIRCERYYQRISSFVTIQYGGTISGFPLRTKMRTTPTYTCNMNNINITLTDDCIRKIYSPLTSGSVSSYTIPDIYLDAEL